MKTVLGIDVGMTGALALYDGEELIIYDMPVTSRNKTKRVDTQELLKIVSHYSPSFACVEMVNAFGMGATSAYNFGWSCGAIEACLTACDIPLFYVTPQVWKKALGCPTDKNEARAWAGELFPNQKENWWPLKKHHGRAEAAMIALFGKKTFVSL